MADHNDHHSMHHLNWSILFNNLRREHPPNIYRNPGHIPRLSKLIAILHNSIHNNSDNSVHDAVFHEFPQEHLNKRSSSVEEAIRK